MKKKISYLAHTVGNAGLFQKSAGLSRKASRLIRKQAGLVSQKSIGLTRKQVGLSQKSIGLTPNPARGILFAQANGKLYFECLIILSGTQNSLPLHFVTGEGRYSEVMRPIRKFSMKNTLKSL